MLLAIYVNQLMCYIFLFQVIFSKDVGKENNFILFLFYSALKINLNDGVRTRLTREIMVAIFN